MLPKITIPSILGLILLPLMFLFSLPAVAFAENKQPGVKSEEGTDPDAALFNEYMDKIVHYSIPVRIRVLKRFVELHPDNRHVPEAKEMISEYEKILGPSDTLELKRMTKPETEIPPHSPETSKDNSIEDSAPPSIPPPVHTIPLPEKTTPTSQSVQMIDGDITDDLAYQKGYQQGFEKGYRKGSSRTYGTGVGAGILGTIVAEILLVVLIVVTVD